ncbi:hypothetical protein [Rhodopseudomonas sp. B29]|nr:hypothetical protein [Rhodopseudomonas sp. B29]
MDTVLDWIGYQLLIRGPWRITCDPSTRFGAWCLSHAGGHVYRKVVRHG